MFGINKHRLRVFLAACSLGALGAVGTFTAVAHAAQTAATTVAVVEYYPSTLLVQLTGATNFYGQLATQAGCTANNQTIDTLKAWTSMAQAALLSGKTVKIGYNVCNGANYITAIDLVQ